MLYRPFSGPSSGVPPEPPKPQSKDIFAEISGSTEEHVIVVFKLSFRYFKTADR